MADASAEDLGRGRWVRLSDVTPQRVTWVWPGRIPAGKLTVLDGDPGLGKSTLWAELAARVTTGSPWPDDTACPFGAVVVLSAEDGLDDTIRPRLDAAGADTTRVVVLEAVEYGPDDERSPSLALDLPRIEAAIRREGAVLLVIDVLVAFLGSRTDSHRDQDIRSALMPLAKMAERTGCAVVVIRHLNKAGAGSPLYRGGGSIGIIGAARSGLLVAVDPEDEGRRILAVTKANLAAPVPALAYRLVPADEHGCARIAWDGATTHTAAQLLAVVDQEDRSTRDEAREFLTDLLTFGPVPARRVKDAARDAGISESTLKRAKSDLGVKAAKQGMEGGWSWSLPAPKGTTEPRRGPHLEREPLRSNVVPFGTPDGWSG